MSPYNANSSDVSDMFRVVGFNYPGYLVHLYVNATYGGVRPEFLLV